MLSPVRTVGSYRLWILLVAALVLSGCSLGTQLQGRQILRSGEYDQGIERFTRKVAENPEDPAAQYYLGRFYLVAEQFEKAHDHLLRATQLDSGKADYFFWLGVAQWSLGQFDQERESYFKVLSIEPTHLQAHIYLGHNYLDRRDYSMALDQYSKALDLNDNHPEALYNKGLTLSKLGLVNEALDSWKLYLKYYPDGVLGRSAIQFLNENGDFTYRLHALGIRKIPLEWIRFQPGTADLRREAYPSLRTIGAFMAQNNADALTIESFYRNDMSLASQRAETIRAFLLQGYPTIDPNRLTVQAHGRPEHVQAGGKMYALDSSIVFKTSR